MTQPFEPLVLDKAPRYREAAYGVIKEAILASQLPPDQPLREEQLAAQLKISRTPVREALAILEHEGLIGPRDSRGLYVRKVTRDEFLDMFVANEQIEPYLARRAALGATSDQLIAVREAIALAKASASQEDMAGFLQASRDFHRLVGMAAGNEVLTQFVVRNEERTDMYLLSYRKHIEPADMRASIEEHETIFEAIAARDPEGAARAVIYHAQSLRQRLTTLFGTGDGGLYG